MAENNFHRRVCDSIRAILPLTHQSVSFALSYLVKSFIYLPVDFYLFSSEIFRVPFPLKSYPLCFFPSCEKNHGRVKSLHLPPSFAPFVFSSPWPPSALLLFLRSAFYSASMLFTSFLCRGMGKREWGVGGVSASPTILTIPYSRGMDAAKGGVHGWRWTVLQESTPSPFRTWVSSRSPLWDRGVNGLGSFSDHSPLMNHSWRMGEWWCTETDMLSCIIRGATLLNNPGGWSIAEGSMDLLCSYNNGRWKSPPPKRLNQWIKNPVRMLSVTFS